jgi:hypothetical protein
MNLCRQPSWIRIMEMSPYERLTDKLIANRQDNAKLEQDNARLVRINS